MEWTGEKVDFTRVSKNKIFIINNDDLVREFYKYSEHFFKAGNIVIDHMIESIDNGVKDNCFFPVVYLYRQSIELILKANVFKHITNKDKQKEYLKLVGHNLSYSFEIFQINFKTSNHMEVEWLKKFLDNITKIDKESDVFRYPISNKGKRYFKKIKRTNLKYVKNNFNTAYQILINSYKDKDVKKTNHRLYKPELFIDVGDYRDLSVIGWKNAILHSDFYPYVKGYIDSADYMRQYTLKDKGKELFLPMCYLFRNAVELSLKRILIEDTVIDYNASMKIIRKKKHSVLGLWNSIKSTIKECLPPKEYITIESAQKYIVMLQNFDSSSSKFRYPVDKNIKFHFKKPITLDSENVALCFSELLNFLDQVNSLLCEKRCCE